MIHANRTHVRMEAYVRIREAEGMEMVVKPAVSVHQDFLAKDAK
jgi:hypothetical protein